MKELGRGTAYNTHNTTSLFRTPQVFIKHLADGRSLRWKSINTHTHTHRQTDTHTHTHTSSKLSCKFNVKDKTPFDEQHDLLYRAVCATDNCIEDYVGETARRIVERAEDHNGRDQHSHLVKHAIENKHLPVVKRDFTILESGYRNNTRKRKIAEALMIKVKNSSLNAKGKSVELKLFN